MPPVGPVGPVGSAVAPGTRLMAPIPVGASVMCQPAIATAVTATAAKLRRIPSGTDVLRAFIGVISSCLFSSKSGSACDRCPPTCQLQ